MKKYIFIISAVLALSSCNDDFLEKAPENVLTESTLLTTDANFETYAWRLYDEFCDTFTGGDGKYKSFIFPSMTSYVQNWGDVYAGTMITNKTFVQNPYFNGTASIPASNTSWDFSYIRKTNIMLANIEGSQMDEEAKLHWEAVARFFRAYYYSRLVEQWGDVPWVESVLSETSEEIYAAQTPRDEVVTKIMADLDFAVKNLRQTSENVVKPAVANALISRFALFEGTWIKYHGTKGDSADLLKRSAAASEALIAEYGTALDGNYDGLFNTEDLGTYKGMILYKEMVANFVCQQSHPGVYELTKFAVDHYLTKNGKPIFQAGNTEFCGDTNMWDEFRNRDQRLLLTVNPPVSSEHFLIGGNPFPSFEPSKPNDNAHYVGTQDPMEYYNLMSDKNEFPYLTYKHPIRFNWNGTNGGFITTPSESAPNGGNYTAWRIYNEWTENTNQGFGNWKNTADRPIFWIEEVLLNYAEAKWELGQFDQAIADQTINVLRDRATVAGMNIAEIKAHADWDPMRDKGDQDGGAYAESYEVDPILWEIRRERMVELMENGFGWNDIRRWKKGKWFTNRIVLGAPVEIGVYKGYDKAEYTASGNLVWDKAPNKTWAKKNLVDKNFNTVDRKTAAYGFTGRFDHPVKLYGADKGGWQDKYYLQPIPSNQIKLNENLKQNPGWE